MIHKFRIKKSEGNAIQIFERTLQGIFQPSRPICLQVSMNASQRVKRGSFLPLFDISKATVQDCTPDWQIDGTTRPESGRWETNSQVSGKDTETKWCKDWRDEEDIYIHTYIYIYLWTISEHVVESANKKCNSWILCCLCCGFATVPLLSQAVTSGLEKGMVKPGVCNREMVDGKRGHGLLRCFLLVDGWKDNQWQTKGASLSDMMGSNTQKYKELWRKSVW